MDNDGPSPYSVPTAILAPGAGFSQASPRLRTIAAEVQMEIRSTSPFLDYFHKVRERTLRVVRAVPADKLEWSYREGKFTPGDLARHIAATERYVFAESVAGGRQRYGGCGHELADGRAAILEFMERMHRESVEIFARLSEADLGRKCASADGSPITTWKLLRAMVEHEIHHRGELYVYLGLLGVEAPALYGLTSEELRDLAAKPQ